MPKSIDTIPELSKILHECVKGYYPDYDKALLDKALKFGEEAHSKQIRASGEPYFTHPIQVATILTELKLDLASIITALLHATVEDTAVTYEELEKEFGEEVAKLVDGVTKLTKLELKSEDHKQAENFRKLLVAMSEDIRVLLVKLGDRMHNMRTIHHVKPEKRKRIGQETLDIYAPLAERIGIQQFKDELQDMSFGVLHPDVRESVINRLKFLRDKGAKGVTNTITEIKDLLDKNDLDGKIVWREKKPCSIWNKMQRKNISFEQLADIIAFRVFVDSTAQCYQVLGLLHANYHVVPERFRDFISTPKSNGYQSLHTTIIGPEKQPIEIQIRTHMMHETAELGVAAHWSYKQGKSVLDEGTEYRWIRELLDILSHSDNPDEFMEDTKLEMYHDQVFCFTPRGDLIALPRDATPVDFAFALHSDIGYNCTGAKVNGRIVPLKHNLQNGDQVEIIRSKNKAPSPAWENFVVTGKARSEIRKFVRASKRSEYIQLGKAILGKYFKKEGYELDDKLLEKNLERLNKKTLDDLLSEVGEGLISRADVLKAVHPEHKQIREKRTKSFFFFNKKGKEVKEEAINIHGLIPGMAVHFAGCCHPLPGDKIVGIVTTGKGVTVHTKDCDTLSSFVDTPERWIEVSWDQESNVSSMHVGRLKILLSHESGSLATLTNEVARGEGNISNLKITHRSTDFFEMIVDIGVHNVKHLNNIIANLRSRSCVHSVERAAD